MAKAVITLKIMPESPEIDLAKVEEEAKKAIAEFAGEGETKTEIEPVAFGLKALKILFVMDESKGSPDPVAEKITGMEGVNSAEIIDVRRAIG
ncbi:elongation factor 1-beta [Candidatus Woesearchaeota archaeon]|nr:elongation factor 1-beta [Candidatus Woesearchaeota archaeon]